MLDSIIPRGIQGIIMLVIGLTFVIVAGLWSWGGYERWTAISELTKSRRYAFLGHDSLAIKSATAAATYRTHSATALAGLDARDETALEQLNRITPSLEEGRRIIPEVAAYLEFMQGQKPTIPGSSPNMDLLETMIDIRETQAPPVPPLPTFRGGMAPDRNMLLVAVELRLQKAWEVGDRQAAADSMGQLALLDPGHPVAPYCQLFSAFDNYKDNRGRIEYLMKSETPDKQSRTAVLRAAALVYPEAGDDALRNIPGDLRSGPELVTAMVKADRPSADLVSAAIQTKNEEVLRTVAAHCVEIEAYDQLKRLATHGSKDFQKSLAIIIATHEFDIATLKELGVDVDGIVPTVYLPHSGFGWAAFHFTDGSGNPPRVGLEYEANGRIIPATDVTRLGSLIHIDMPGASRQILKIKMRGEVVYNKEIRR